MTFSSPVIVEAKRSPMGLFGGSLSQLSAVDIASQVVRSMLDEGLEALDSVSLGCVLQAGLGQAAARQVVLKSGLSLNTPALLINKVCGSGMAAIVWAAQQLQQQGVHMLLAGGMESMSRAPGLTPGRFGWKFGHQTMRDHLLLDGLEDAATHKSMGMLVEDTIHAEGLNRDAHDAYAENTARRVLDAQKNNFFNKQIVPLSVKNALLEADETLTKVDVQKIRKLRPAFKETGMLTAATSSGLADGAAVLALATEAFAREKELSFSAFMKGWATFACAPKDFIKAPIGATEKLLAQLEWHPKDVDVWEVNEAFATAPLLFMKAFDIGAERMNMWGGALCLGHPLGSSGARIVVQLAHLLVEKKLKRGVAAICIGGGEGMALALENAKT